MGDSYRPGASSRDRSPDSWRPPRQHDRSGPPPTPPWDSRRGNDMYHFQGSRDRDREAPRDFRRNSAKDFAHRPRIRDQFRRHSPPRFNGYGYRQRGPPPPRTAANRLILRHQDRETTEDFGVSKSGAALKFRNLDDLTDSEEEDMAQSEDEDPDRRGTKRVRLNGAGLDGAAATVKWSNPDPYTALPPVEEASIKRTDVVKLIRKARVETTMGLTTAKSANDFISFDDDSGDSEDDVPSVPTGLSAPARSAIQARVPFPAKPAPVMGTSQSLLPHPKQPAAVQSESSKTASKKRKRGLELGDDAPQPRADNQIYSDERVQDKWTASSGVDTTPWLEAHPPTDLANVLLHKEIIDFYEWVKPKDYEQTVREATFRRIEDMLNGWNRGGRLHAFGSYAAGLYLPVGDMDLAYLTVKHRPGVTAKEVSKGHCWSFVKYLRRQGVADNINPIAHAKVPIVKYKDRLSGLKIDLSFDNDSGLAAIANFQNWKTEYPTMPVIVAIVKQFLMIRGLNDVATGGLGGFSIICLVTSFFQHLPPTKPPINLGGVLLDFFNYYGNLFDREQVAIRMEPPAYLEKVALTNTFKNGGDKKPDKLVIIDPNKADNNISGGTKDIGIIFESFSMAHQALSSRLSAYKPGPSNSSPTSFLECIIGGNFTEYEQSRRKLYGLSVGNTAGRTPDPPDEGADSALRSGQAPKAPTRAMRRATRLKTLRPEFAASVRHTISLTDALKLGGYSSAEDMDTDLMIREVAATKLAATKSRSR